MHFLARPLFLLGFAIGEVSAPTPSPSTGTAMVGLQQELETLATIDSHRGAYDLRPSKAPAQFIAANPEQQFDIGFQLDGFHITRTGTNGMEVSFRIAHIGKRDGPSITEHAGSWNHEGDRAIADHGAYQVEYVNGPQGMRQNFIVHEEPHGNGPLEVQLRTSGDLHPVDVGNDVIALLDSTGSTKLHYRDLHVWDTRGDTLEASATVRDGLIVLAVNDVDVEYPITIDPITTTPVLTLESNLAGTRLGESLSSAGDVNGDGYSDIIIGVPVWSNGQVGEGRAQVHHGGANGPTATVAWAFETDQIGANMGFNLGGGTSVATAGDVNGDGYSDVIVAASEYDNGQTNEGRVWVFHGSATGLSATPAWVVESDQANSRFGHSVTCAGDVNGDGYSDVIIGAYQFDNGQTDEGRVFVYHGGPAGLATTPAWTMENNQAGARFGYSVASAGDVNGDGYSDVIIGSPGYDAPENGEGRAYVYHGSATGLAAVAAWTTESNQATSQTGYSVSSAGDVNGDGYSDVVVGIPFYAASFANDGRIVIHTGSPAGLNVAATVTLSNGSEAQFGRSVACAGDVNGDGFSDVIIGAPYWEAVGSERGCAFVYSGYALGVVGHWTEASTQDFSLFAFAVASAGDVNGDGYSDVIVGAPQYDNGQTNEGQARVYTGRPSECGPVAHTALPGPQAGAHFGQRLAGAGDVNGDGYSDVIIGARHYSNGQIEEGAVFVHHGGPNGINTTAAVMRESNYASSKMGYSVAGAGDVNGDGYSDVIIGAPYRLAGMTPNGYAYVYLGSSAGIVATAQGFTASGADSELGFAVSSAGDVNGDGYSDMIIGAPGSGLAYMVRGSPTGLTGTGTQTLGGPLNSRFGESVATAGDVNGDGYSDVIIGAGSTATGGTAYLYLGGPAGLIPIPAWSASAGQAGASFASNAISGPSAAAAGDVNGDGYGDVIIGAYNYDNGQVNEGRAYVYHGSATGLSATPDWISESNEADAWFGITVGSAGDVNGDGYSDAIIGACQFGPDNTGRVSIVLGGPTGLQAMYASFNGPLPNSEFAHSASSAGDVDGDGFTDLIIGAYEMNSTAGFVYMHHGNDRGTSPFHTSKRQNLRLYNTNLSAPISATNLSDLQFGLGLFARPFLGRTKTRIAWETRIQGQPFSNAAGSIANSTAFTAQQPTYALGPVAGQEHKVLVDKTGGGTTGITAHKVRARVRYDPVTALTGQVFGPWRYMPGYMDGLGSHNNVPLPVELLYFEATCHEGRVHLEWATASERNSSHFVVQRSADGTIWSDLDTVHAAGNSFVQVEYTFTDQVPWSHGTVLYRLVEHDLDGPTVILPIRAVEGCVPKNGAFIFPNPTNGVAHIDVSVLGTRSGRLLLTDAMGREISTFMVEAGTLQFRVNASHLAAGSYALLLLNEYHEPVALGRLLKE